MGTANKKGMVLQHRVDREQHDDQPRQTARAASVCCDDARQPASAGGPSSLWLLIHTKPSGQEVTCEPGSESESM